MKYKAFNITAAIYFFTMIIFGLVVNHLINIFRNHPFDMNDLGQTFTLACALTLGMTLGLRAKLKPIFKYLNTEIETEPQTYISETIVEISNTKDISKSLEEANYTITYTDNNHEIIKICSELKPLRYGSAATLKLERNSIKIRSFRVGDNDKKRLKAFTDELIGILR